MTGEIYFVKLGGVALELFDLSTAVQFNEDQLEMLGFCSVLVQGLPCLHCTGLDTENSELQQEAGRRNSLLTSARLLVNSQN